MLEDQDQRQEATTPGASYIVQAPAGSGKTELLTQRFLRLLSTVQAPEQIVALTFTRKAASEMRERILLALQKAHDNISPLLEHEEKTQSYAKKALARDAMLGWQLLQQPHRLRVLTIDALCQWLTDALPLQTKDTSFAKVTEDAPKLYRKAAKACLYHALEDASYQKAISALLSHLDNRQDYLVTLFAEILASREQWTPLLFSAQKKTRTWLKKALENIEKQAIQRLETSIPVTLWEAIADISKQLAIVEANPASPRYSLCTWTYNTPKDKPFFVALYTALATQGKQLRKVFDHHVGLIKGHCSAEVYLQIKTKSKTLLQELSRYPDFLPLLLRVKNLPAPDYEEKEWAILQALFTLLPLLLAHLTVLFQEENQVDFTAIALKAHQALGRDTTPTDLSLYIDHAIHHLLVDEFQDTSLLQFAILEKLVQGWLPEEGKTLFLVGDPMQSVYRFRQAEVGLFLKAQQEGIAHIALTPLLLRTNFRSGASIVDFINQHCEVLFPKEEDIASGAISFQKAIPLLSKEKDLLSLKTFSSPLQEAEAIADAIEIAWQEDPQTRIAILVRSRSMLRFILPVLRKRNLPFQGIEMEPLANLLHIRDMWSLTKALLLPAHRLAWIALLRSPWCGLELIDLHLVCSFKKQQSIFLTLQEIENIEGLSQEATTRLGFLENVLQQAYSERYRQPLRNWVVETAKKLHSDFLFDAQQQRDIEQFLQLLEQEASVEEFVDIPAFEQKISQLYTKESTPSLLQIMTIHKSKGLEFDMVILPFLGKKPPQKEKPLLRWLRLPAQAQREYVLLSPIKGFVEQPCPLYDYLGELEKEKDTYEQQRLLYVALTRAKKKLYLFDNSIRASEGSFRKALEEAKVVFSLEPSIEEEHTTSPLPSLVRLPLSFYFNTSYTPSNTITTQPFLSLATPSNARIFGIIAHEVLEWVCHHHITSLSALSLAFVQSRFLQKGIDVDNTMLQLLLTQIETFLQDERGLWISKKHAEEQNELALLVEEEGQLCIRIIDRTFVADGKRWIIDFKTGAETTKEKTAHQAQLMGYAKHWAQTHQEEIYCGLYYLTNALWVDWKYAYIQSSST